MERLDRLVWCHVRTQFVLDLGRRGPSRADLYQSKKVTVPPHLQTHLGQPAGGLVGGNGRRGGPHPATFQGSGVVLEACLPGSCARV